MVEVLFYHLQRDPLERVLPALLEKSLSRDWRCLVRVGNRERAEVLDGVLWTFRDDSFLPHALSGSSIDARQPILLTDDRSANPNGADVCFVVDGTDLGEIDGYQRVVYMFDGADQSAVQAARDVWRQTKGQGHNVTYWQQGDDGRWAQKA